MAKRDYYEILGISKSASKDEIKKIAMSNMINKYEPLTMQKKVNSKSIIELKVLFNISLDVI